MKPYSVIICALVLNICLYAQAGEIVLATANSFQFTAKDLPAEIEAAYSSYPARLAEIRQNLLDEQISGVLIEIEADARKIPKEKLLENEVTSKVPPPTDGQIKAVYDANRETIGPRTYEEIRPQIIAFLRSQPEKDAYLQFIGQLKAKYVFAAGKDVNAPNLNNSEVLATVGKQRITVADFDARNKLKISDFEENFYDQIMSELEQLVFSALAVAEAKSLGLPPADLIAREITNRLREYSAAERETLQNNFQAKLFHKYQAKFLLKEPELFVQDISTDDDPGKGPPNAPVTVVLFSDFQCPACAAVDPVLEKVVAEYSNKIRFVVRDFPLINVHENAFRAALAANAANAQGKFFDYVDVLYKNQDKLDDASLMQFAADLGLNMEQFKLDFKNEKFAEEVRKDIADGKSYGVSGTPSIFVNGIKVRKLSVDAFRKAIERSLKK